MHEKLVNIRIWRHLDNGLDCVIRIVFIILLLIGLYTTYDSYLVYSGASDNSLFRYKPSEDDNTEHLGELSDDCVAWITVDGTNIDYPVMQGTDNSVYLNTDPYGKFSLSGAIFLDSRNGPLFMDPYSLIYGHHMEYGKMFGALDDFADEDYFDGHSTGTLIVKNGGTYHIKFFAFLTTQVSAGEIFNPTERPKEEVLTYIESNASVLKTHGDGNIIALSTCKTPGSVDRYVLAGELEETIEEGQSTAFPGNAGETEEK